MSTPLIPIDMIQNIASSIMKELGAGYPEAIYRNALWKELILHDSKTVMEQSVPIVFRGQYLGMCRADLVTKDYVIEIKALKTVLPCVGHQIKKYIKHLSEVEPTSNRMGLVINFNQHTETLDFLLFQPSSHSTTTQPKQTQAADIMMNSEESVNTVNKEASF